MNNRIPHNCKTCEIPLIGTGGAEACPHFNGNPNAQCPKYQRIGTEWMRLNEDRTFEKFAAWDEKHRERVGRGPASSTLRDLMARDLVRWLDCYDVRATFHLDGPPDDEALLLALLDVKPVCRADRMAAVLLAAALRGNVAAWEQIDRLLDRLDGPSA